MNKKTHDIFLVSRLCIASTFFYSLQHSLTKPFFAKFGSDWQVVFTAGAISELLIVLMVAGLCFNRDYRESLTKLLKTPHARVKLIAVSTLSISSLLIYLWAMTMGSPVYISTISNIFPLYWVLIESLVNKEKLNKESLLVLILAAAIIITSAVVYGVRHHFSNLVETAALATVMSVCFTASMSLQKKFFGKDKVFTYITVSSFIDAPIYLVVTLISLCTFGHNMDLSAGFPYLIPMYLLGYASAHIIGKFLFQKASFMNNIDMEMKFWSSVWFFLVPMLVVVESYVIKIFIKDYKFEVTKLDFICMFTLMASLITVGALNDIKRFGKKSDC